MCEYQYVRYVDVLNYLKHAKYSRVSVVAGDNQVKYILISKIMLCYTVAASDTTAEARREISWLLVCHEKFHS